MQVLAVSKPRRIHLIGPQVGCNAAVCTHRALAGRIDQRDDDAVALRFDRTNDVDTERLELGSGELAGMVSSSLPDEASAPTKDGDPRRNVRGLSPGANGDARRRVGTPCEWLVEPHDHVEREVTQATDRHHYDPCMIAIVLFVQPTAGVRSTR